MKRSIYIFFLVLFATNIATANDIKTLKTFIYHHCTVLDRDLNVLNEIPSTSGDPMGIFTLAEIERQKYIVITLAEKSIYEIQVVNIVENEIMNGERIDMYQGGMTINGQIIVINVFLEYDINKNTSIPDIITIDVNNSPNYIQLKGLVSTLH